MDVFHGSNLHTGSIAFWGDSSTYTRNLNTSCIWQCKITGRSFTKLSEATETPTLGNPQNSINGLLFNASRALIALSSTTWFNGLHQGNGMLYMVSRHTSTEGAWFDNTASTTVNTGIYIGNSNYRLTATRSASGTANQLNSGASVPTDKPYIHSFRLATGTNGSRYVRDNGTAIQWTYGTWATGNASHNARIGSLSNSNNASGFSTALPDGNVLYELVIFNRAHNDDERFQWYSYFKNKYNL